MSENVRNLCQALVAPWSCQLRGPRVATRLPRPGTRSTPDPPAPHGSCSSLRPCLLSLPRRAPRTSCHFSIFSGEHIIQASYLSFRCLLNGWRLIVFPCAFLNRSKCNTLSPGANAATMTTWHVSAGDGGHSISSSQCFLVRPGLAVVSSAEEPLSSETSCEDYGQNWECQESIGGTLFESSGYDSMKSPVCWPEKIRE